ncbi:MAG: Stp1/IreP family PP2C-type Ser/Thr phosphatase [Planctomycetes bacterium]|nr:Stp1/IreP family PP2C-type Ser/Thr phosphatase [Planctomycetota bacterium]
MTEFLEIAVKTDVGRVRSENQDHYCVLEPDGSDAGRRKGSLVVVADGMGGHTGGTVASHTAVDAIEEAFKASELVSMHEILESLIIAGNRAVRTKAEANPQMRDMGTTCVSLLARGRHVVVAHLGDSRCYMFRGDRAEIVTRDHTYLNELVDIGLLTPEQAEGHPDKNIITRCVGMSAKLEIEFNHRVVEPGDAFLMCSDGLSNFVKTDELLQLISKHSAEETCARLVKLANDRGGDDNITVAVIKVHNPPAIDDDLAKLDDEELQYSSKVTPVIRRDEIGASNVDSEADTAEGTRRPEIDTEEMERPNVASPDPSLEDTVPIRARKKNDRAGDRNERESDGPRLSGLSPWYWLIGAEILLLVILQFWINRY